jgi:hypothetical protein
MAASASNGVSGQTPVKRKNEEQHHATEEKRIRQDGHSPQEVAQGTQDNPVDIESSPDADARNTLSRQASIPSRADLPIKE